MKLRIHKTIPLSMVDGPGSRFAVFLNKCNMRCLYCHNPETQIECVHCGFCVGYCNFDALIEHSRRIIWKKEFCTDCGVCDAMCPRKATPRTEEVDIADLAKEILRNARFLSGVTLSGGECTLQAEGLIELSRLIKQNSDLTVFLDTNGLIDDGILDKLIPEVDGFLLDVKCMDEKKHIELTGTSNSQVLKNLNKIAASGKLIEVRVVLFKDYSDDVDEVRSIALACRDAGFQGTFILIPFRSEGVRGNYNSLVDPKVTYCDIEDIIS